MTWMSTRIKEKESDGSIRNVGHVLPPLHGNAGPAPSAEVDEIRPMEGEKEAPLHGNRSRRGAREELRSNQWQSLKDHHAPLAATEWQGKKKKNHIGSLLVCG